MNILILTARFGMGHVKAAEAVEEKLQADPRFGRVETVDFIDYLFPHISRKIYSTFNRMVFHNTELYNKAIDATDNVSLLPMKAYISWKIGRLIRQKDADGIIAIFPCCSRYVAAYKEFTGDDIPLFTCITDIHPHGEWIADHTDGYFAGSLETRKQLMEKGVSPDRIWVTGIPVRREFSEKKNFDASQDRGSRRLVGTAESELEKQVARTAESDPEEHASRIAESAAGAPVHEPEARAPRILVMGGGLGLASDQEKLDQLLASAVRRCNAEVTVVCGSNAERKAELEREHPEFRTLGFTDEVDSLMRETDLLITKPGGITLFEAIETGTPLLFIEPELSQEVYNARFAERHGIAKVFWSGDQATPEGLMELLRNSREMEKMESRMADLRWLYGQVSIADAIAVSAGRHHGGQGQIGELRYGY